ncbi:MAG TPA: tRNA pseudouridine(38-40) synthase TruA [Dehalococcoidia bacterium]
MEEERRTFAVRLEYDGTHYRGSQLQRNGPSIQGELERAAEPLAGSPVRAHFAGRTDAGVHAAGQVAAIVLPARWTTGELQRALNARLPNDIAVVAVTEAPAGFDLRREAFWRRYRYQIWNAEVRSPLLRRSAWHVRYALDDGAMRQAATLLVGRHDFASFAAPLQQPGAASVRTMYEVAVTREGRLLQFQFRANGFLPHQVRRMVGALVELGRGRLSELQFANWLWSPRTGVAGPAAPPHGLCLLDVAYAGLGFEGGEI